MTSRRLLAAAAVALLSFGGRAPARPLALEPDDRIVVVGNTFAERLAQSGYFDALAHVAHPGHRLVIRHVPWSADEVGVRPREMNVPTMEDHLARLKPDVIVMCFGMSESFAGRDGLETFERDLAALLDARAGERVVLISPIAHEDLGPPWPTAAAVHERNATLAAYADVLRRAAAERGLVFVDLLDVEAAPGSRLTSNGIHPTERGCAVYTERIGRALGWLDDEGAGDPADAEAAAALRRLACDKHYHFRLLYRPTNTEYVFGRRHEPYGVVNFPPEMAQLERMVEARERAIWAMDKPAPAALFAALPEGPTVWERLPLPSAFPEDDWEPASVEAKGAENSVGGLEIRAPDEFARSFELADGYAIECFASERDFEELANPLAMGFDERGRLWVLCTPTYPHLLPGEHPRCRLIILEDADRDGRADRRTVFADRLYIPTGFAIDVDAVYVGQAPELLKLTDEDGDDVADRREIVLSGFGMPDSHHTISAFEWDPGGGFLMHEGVFTRTNVETPYGTRRGHGAAVWRFDPRTQRLELLSHCYYNNPWGHAFDDYGQSVLADASGGDNYCFSRVITAFEFPRKPGKPHRFLHRGRPTAGCEIVSSRHFPDDAQGTFLVNQSIGFHGTRWDRLIVDGSGWRAERMPWDMLKGADTNFRPVAMEIGPDGALYIADWCNPLIGHMQYSVRDPRRDHAHGRIWRVRHARRPLLDPPGVGAASIPELVELLRLPERNTRQHVRRRLQTAPRDEVLPALESMRERLAPDDPLHDRLVLETLWVKQGHGILDPTAIDETLSLARPDVRAGAVRVVRHGLQTGALDPTDVWSLIERAVEDADMRVRLEGVVACGFLDSPDAAALAARVTGLPMDEGLRVALEETLAYLERYGESDSEVVRRLRLERAPTEKLLEAPLDEAAALALVARADAPLARRAAAIEHLAGAEPGAKAVRLVRELNQAWRREAAAEAIGPLLLGLPATAIDRVREDLLGLAREGNGAARSLGVAILMKHGGFDDVPAAADGNVVADALGWLDAKDAPVEAIARLRRDVEQGAVAPARAVPQIVRHARDHADTFSWLAGHVDAVAGSGLHQWSTAHETAMAALRGMHLVESWPDGFDAYRVSGPTSETLELGRRIYHDEARGCARCHGGDGGGVPGFPPLDRSPWVLGSPERAAGIVVHGLMGRLRLHDGATYESAMAPLGDNLDDEEIAAVLSYVRRSWGNFAPPVTTEQVARARRVTPRSGLWEVAALQTAHPLYRDRILTSGATAATVHPGGLPGRTLLIALSLFAVPAVVVVALLALLLRAQGSRRGSSRV